MKKLIYSAAIIAAMMLTLASCGGKDKNKNKETPANQIEGTVENGEKTGAAFNKFKGEITNVRATLAADARIANAKTTLNGNKFSLNLNPIDAQYLMAAFTPEEIAAGTNVSDPTAKTMAVQVRAYGDEGNTYFIGDFVNGKVAVTASTSSMGLTAVQCARMFFDKDVTASGSTSYADTSIIHDEESGQSAEFIMIHTTEMNGTWKAGWNRVYATTAVTYKEVSPTNPEDLVKVTLTIKSTISTEAVSGLKWYFDEDYQALIDQAELGIFVGAPAKAIVKEKLSNPFGKIFRSPEK